MAKERAQVQVEDILNLSQATKTQLLSGINAGSMIKTGMVNQTVLPFDMILTDGDQVLIDSDGNVLLA